MAKTVRRVKRKTGRRICRKYSRCKTKKRVKRKYNQKRKRSYKKRSRERIIQDGGSCCARPAKNPKKKQRRRQQAQATEAAATTRTRAGPRVTLATRWKEMSSPPPSGPEKKYSPEEVEIILLGLIEQESELLPRDTKLEAVVYYDPDQHGNFKKWKERVRYQIIRMPPLWHFIPEDAKDTSFSIDYDNNIGHKIENEEEIFLLEDHLKIGPPYELTSESIASRTVDDPDPEPAEHTGDTPESTEPTTTEPDPEPEPEPELPANAVTAQLTLDIEMPKDDKLPEFKTKFESSVADATETHPDKVIITSITAGSVIVDFYIAPADDGSAMIAEDELLIALMPGVNIAGAVLTANSVTAAPTLVTPPEPEPETETISSKLRLARVHQLRNRGGVSNVSSTYKVEPSDTGSPDASVTQATIAPRGRNRQSYLTQSHPTSSIQTQVTSSIVNKGPEMDVTNVFDPTPVQNLMTQRSRSRTKRKQAGLTKKQMMEQIKSLEKQLSQAIAEQRDLPPVSHQRGDSGIIRLKSSDYEHERIGGIVQNLYKERESLMLRYPPKTLEINRMIVKQEGGVEMEMNNVPYFHIPSKDFYAYALDESKYYQSGRISENSVLYTPKLLVLPEEVIVDLNRNRVTKRSKRREPIELTLQDNVKISLRGVSCEYERF